MPAEPAPSVNPRQPEESVLVAAARAMRPRQWAKNVLVAAAPFTAGRLLEPDVAVATVAAFVSFCLVSSTVYLINDARDVEEDRKHPTKRLRPIPLGTLPLRVAWILAAVLVVAGLGLALLTHVVLAVILAVYLAVQVAYSAGLKHEPVLDLAVVASGFLLRAIAGGVASDIDLSQWFLLVASFGSLFMVAGKRYSEMHSIGAAAGTRRSLESYSVSYLRFVWTLAATVTITAYTLWALEHDAAGNYSWAAWSIGPFVLGMLRYAVDIDRGGAGTPEDIVLGDRVLRLLGLLWLGLVGLSVLVA
ncbi:MAG TPA: decaprenyl-phosphate phosphoribosyltransferase [Nocardioidaceae bacterium]|nr:decaprenyl-phosphate phosphoribosyltransferase [Nocardioidaceae bacterium]